VIVLAPRWYLRFALSYRDVEELIAERGIQVDHVTIYRAVDQFGQVIDVFVSPISGRSGSRRFFERAIGATKVTPVEVTIDQAPVYSAVLDELLPAAWHRTDRYANHRVECDHGRLKVRLRPKRGLKQDRSARVIIVGHGFVQNLRRGHHDLASEEPVNQRVAVAFNQLALAIWTPDHVATSPRRELIRCNSAAVHPRQPRGGRQRRIGRRLRGVLD
jgi:transposase-like protein